MQIQNQIVYLFTILTGVSCSVTLFVAFTIKDDKNRGKNGLSGLGAGHDSGDEEE